jgi:hypothetical protein
MSSFATHALRASASLPGLASKSGRRMGASGSSTRRSAPPGTRASSDSPIMNLSDGCKGEPVPDGVKLPLTCGEEAGTYTCPPLSSICAVLVRQTVLCRACDEL